MITDFETLLIELRRAVLDGCPVTVDTVIRTLERLTDNTAHNSHDVAAAVLRGHVKPRTP